MPFIEEDNYELLLSDIEEAKHKKEQIENEFNQLHEEHSTFKQKSRSISIILGSLLGIAIGVIVLFSTGAFDDDNKKDDETDKKEINITAIKAKEARRVIDSLKRLRRSGSNRASSTSNSSGSYDVNKATNNVAKNTKGKTIYSVQIGVFSQRKQALLSKNLIPSIVVPTDGFFKYSIGLYTSLSEAKNLKNELVSIGFSDAFVASYVNGKRQKIHH